MARGKATMTTLLRLLADYGLAVAFFNVLLAQLGVPLPAYPILIVTGALSVQGRFPTPALFATAVAAALIADLAWYAGGRRFGGRVVRAVCRVSISPDSCVRQTESLFARWGARSLMVAKFIPGFAAIATSLAGNMRLPIARFLLYDAIGAGLWAGVAIALGIVFRNAVTDILLVLEEMGRIGLVVVAAALALFIAFKVWQRQRLIREVRMARIDIDELTRLIDGGEAPAIIDVRDHPARLRDGSIPGALHLPLDAVDDVLPDLPRDRDVVVYCACPNEISAARVAKRLQRAGFKRVRPLLGGIDAWERAGRPIERIDDAERSEAAAST
jgi:membrane protein DedA with SNARE-associated domain/rhodanese-related sulfurtransferase